MLAARVEPKNAPQESEKTDNFKPLVFREFQAGVDSQAWGLLFEGPQRPAEGRSRGRTLVQARRRSGKCLRTGLSRALLRAGPWRPAEGRLRGRASLQASRRPGTRIRTGKSRILLLGG